MSELTYCPVCRARCGAGTDNPNPNGLWCKGCDDRLRAAGGGVAPRARDHQVAHTLSRDHLTAHIYNTKDPLETLNMCIKWLDRASPASYSNPAFHPAAGLNDSFRYKKEDFNPDSSPPFDIEGHRHSHQLYIAALAAFRLYGPCQFALCWLRHAHQADKKVLPFLLGGTSTGIHPWTTGFHSGMYNPTWAATPGALDWLRDSAVDVELRACDGIGCKKVEEKPKAFKACGRCKFTYYCGVECQKSDWKTGNHKSWCATMPQASSKS